MIAATSRVFPFALSLFAPPFLTIYPEASDFPTPDQIRSFVAATNVTAFLAFPTSLDPPLARRLFPQKLKSAAF